MVFAAALSLRSRVGRRQVQHFQICDRGRAPVPFSPVESYATDRSAKSVTAITFVALGTSLPDTFASKTAAQNEPTADNAIGNVTGSNSVNVFFGLGVPWLLGAVYWSAMGATPEWLARFDPVTGSNPVSQAVFDASIANANSAFKGGFAYAAWYVSFWSAALVGYLLRTRHGYSSLVVMGTAELGVFYDRNNHTMVVFEAQSVSFTTLAA